MHSKLALHCYPTGQNRVEICGGAVCSLPGALSTNMVFGILDSLRTLFALPGVSSCANCSYSSYKM